MWKPVLLATLAATLIGGWAGRSTGRSEAGAGKGPASGGTASSNRRALPEPKWTAEDFIHSTRERAEKIDAPGYNMLTEKLADWTDQEIRTALEASLTDPDCVVENGAGSALTGLLAGEWMRRDLAAVLAWFDRQESPVVRNKMAYLMDQRWPPGKGQEGMAFLRAHRDLLRTTGYSGILCRALQDGANENAAAVTAVLEQMEKDGFKFKSGTGLDFPEGFDFVKLSGSDEFKRLWDDGGGLLFIMGWLKNDKDGAFDWLLENHGAKGLADFGMSSYQPGIQEWMAGRFERLEPAVREDYVEAMKGRWLSGPGGLAAFAKGIQDPVIRGEIEAIGVQSLYGGGAHSVIPLLEGMPDVEKRVELLETVPPPENLSKLMSWNGGRFTETDENLLRQKLAEWNTSGDRAEAIIQRFKKP